jgi:hypothetical protein
MHFALEEDEMSPMLLATAVLDRLRTKARTPVPVQKPQPETPHQRRERLRREVLARGGTLERIETIHGDCPTQTAQQIADLSRWIERQSTDILPG